MAIDGSPAGRGQRPVQSAHDSERDAALVAEQVADGRHLVSDLYVVRVAERQGLRRTPRGFATTLSATSVAASFPMISAFIESLFEKRP